MTPEADLEQFQQAAAAAPVETPPQDARVVSDEDKLAFLAHIMTGAPFIKQYNFGVDGLIELTTVPSDELFRIRLCVQNTFDKTAWEYMVRSMTIAASVRRCEVGGKIIAPVIDRSWAGTDAYSGFLERVPQGLLSIIESLYLDFSSTLSTLIDKVSDRSFWPTP
jgi:hypothetical protein